MQSLHARDFSFHGRNGGDVEPGSKPVITSQCDTQDELNLGTLSGGVRLETDLGRRVMAMQKENRATVISAGGSFGAVIRHGGFGGISHSSL